jgi:signal peptidase II
MNTPPRRLGPAATLWLHGALFLLVLLFDQWTKHVMRLRYSLPGGEPDYALSTPILGEWLQFRLVYNFGAAFGSKPQGILPFLHPTLFFAIFSFVAILFLAYYYRRLGAQERTARLGVMFILAGALGNLTDRLTLHKVTDFIDVGIPGFDPRWPVFNIADSSVFVGVVLLLIPSLFGRKQAPAKKRASLSDEDETHA